MEAEERRGGLGLWVGAVDFHTLALLAGGGGGRVRSSHVRRGSRFAASLGLAVRPPGTQALNTTTAEACAEDVV